MLRQSQKQEISDEVLSYEITLALETGEVVELNKESGLYEPVGEYEAEYEADEVVTVKYDGKVRQRILKFARVVLQKRGVKDIDKINVQDNEVKKITKTMRSENRSAGLGALNDGDYQAAIEQVRAKYEPAYTRTIFQVIYWAILRDDMFSVVTQGNQTGVNCRFELDIPDDYWDTEQDGDNYDELDEVIFSDMPEPLKLRQNDKMEIMIALATSLVNHSEGLSEKIGELSAVVFAGFSLLTEEFDDATMFRTRLVSILPRYVESEHRSFNGSIAGSGVFVSKKKTGKPEVVAVKEENTATD